jgi:hypothetical protein
MLKTASIFRMRPISGKGALVLMSMVMARYRDIPDDLSTPADESVTKTTVPWCFAYGEREWRAGDDFSVIEQRARGDFMATPPVQPQGRIDCITGAPL